jgi:hypothetical protein
MKDKWGELRSATEEGLPYEIWRVLNSVGDSDALVDMCHYVSSKMSWSALMSVKIMADTHDDYVVSSLIKLPPAPSDFGNAVYMGPS